MGRDGGGRRAGPGSGPGGARIPRFGSDARLSYELVSKYCCNWASWKHPHQHPPQHPPQRHHQRQRRLAISLQHSTIRISPWSSQKGEAPDTDTDTDTAGGGGRRSLSSVWSPRIPMPKRRPTNDLLPLPLHPSPSLSLPFSPPPPKSNSPPNPNPNPNPSAARTPT